MTYTTEQLAPNHFYELEAVEGPLAVFVDDSTSTAVVIERTTRRTVKRKRGETAWSDMVRWARDNRDRYLDPDED